MFVMFAGYFIYDLLDMGIHDRKRSSNLLIHHCLVIISFFLLVLFVTNSVILIFHIFSCR